jgi:dUTPase
LHTEIVPCGKHTKIVFKIIQKIKSKKNSIIRGDSSDIKKVDLIIDNLLGLIDRGYLGA